MIYDQNKKYLQFFHFCVNYKKSDQTLNTEASSL